MSNDYLAALSKGYLARKMKLTKTAEISIAATYSRTIQDLAIKLAMSKDGSLSQAFLKGRMTTLYQELYTMQKSFISDAAKLAIEEHTDIMNYIGFKAGIEDSFGSLFSGIGQDVLTVLSKGNLYKDGLGLSDRIWNTTKYNQGMISNILKQGALAGTDSRKLAEVLTKYVNPEAAKPWPKSRVRELLGYTPPRDIDYNAMRLARTSISHAYSLATRTAAEKNPFLKGFIWHSALIHNRTCNICRERDGQHFTAKDLPFDHPNGLCWEEPDLGNESFEDLGKRLGDWGRGNPDKTLDAWWKKEGKGKPKPEVTKTPPKPKEVKPKEVKPPKEKVYARPQDHPEFLQRNYGTLMQKLKDSGMKQSHIDSIMLRIKEAPEFMQRYFKRYQEHMKIDELSSTEGAWYHPKSKGLTLQMERDASGVTGKSPFATFFHEFGHLLDHAMGYPNIFQEFQVAIKKDASEYFKKIKFNDGGYSEERIKTSGRFSMSSVASALDESANTSVKSWLTNKLRAEGDDASGVQDIFSGLTFNRVRPKWGHDTDYWKRGLDPMDQISSEAWAHMTSDWTIPERRKIMEKWFPNAMQEYKKIIEEELGYNDKGNLI